MSNYVVYTRVSTTKQGQSGLGLEAQEAMARRYLNGVEPVAWYTEVESGGSDSRPELAKAIARVRSLKDGVLLCAKLDRLSRSVRFILGLADEGIKVRFADAPSIRLDGNASDRFVVTVIGGAAELERNLASERTKLALAAKRERGGVLGNAASLRPGNDAKARRAHAVALRLRPTLDAYRAAGMTQAAMAAALAQSGVPTPSGVGQWSQPQVNRVLRRLGSGDHSTLTAA